MIEHMLYHYMRIIKSIHNKKALTEVRASKSD